jgi:hypothetical protein
MKRFRRIPVAALLLGACLVPATAARAEESLTVHASFTPDRLSAVTNLSLTASFLSGDANPPSPVTRVTLYAPAGIEVDARGAGTCTAAALQQRGPSGCPADSRAGFGGGIGVLTLPKETIHATYTLDFFWLSSPFGGEVTA